jgi:hypothetical protein
LLSIDGLGILARMKTHDCTTLLRGWYYTARHTTAVSLAGFGLALLALAFVALPAPAFGGDFPTFLFASEGARKIIRYDSDGKAVWEYPAEMSRDVWALPNGHVLFCYNRQYDPAKHDNPSGVIEVTSDKKVVFEFTTTGQVWSCQRMLDGSTLVGAASQGLLLVVGPDAKILKSIRLKNAPGHSCLRNARQLANGHFLVAEESAHAVREYGADGAMLREINVGFAPYSAIRLENGNTLVCGQQTVVEVDPADKRVWTVEGKELPLGIRWFAGAQLMPNGNVFVCNAGGKVPFLEISRSNGIVWQSPGGWTVPIGHGIHRLDVAGPARK